MAIIKNRTHAFEIQINRNGYKKVIQNNLKKWMFGLEWLVVVLEGDIFLQRSWDSWFSIVYPHSGFGSHFSQSVKKKFYWMTITLNRPDNIVSLRQCIEEDIVIWRLTYSKYNQRTQHRIEHCQIVNRRLCEQYLNHKLMERAIYIYNKPTD